MVKELNMKNIQEWDQLIICELMMIWDQKKRNKTSNKHKQTYDVQFEIHLILKKYQKKVSQNQQRNEKENGSRLLLINYKISREDKFQNILKLIYLQSLILLYIKRKKNLGRRKIMKKKKSQNLNKKLLQR
ncbi:unnamed protein product [Paramecium sonneborni]|uniref:Uncharacterized protein n=1 Tax=Paramecium sonneborni TaxID=65129 RepID=A0A8S1QS96_9CILI|nr:unnamed protein product [Paramecium sonneborni]